MDSPRRIASLAFSLCLFWCALPAQAEVISAYGRSQNVSRQIANAITSGAGHTCTRFEDGTVRCWGQNVTGQLGDGTTTNRSSPVTVQRLANINLTAVVTLAAGADHTCALKVTGNVVCWGDNAQGQLGLGDSTIARRVRATTDVDLDNVVSIAAGGFHTCALLANGRVFCWGANASGQLGNNLTGGPRFAPVQVVTVGNFLLTNVRAIVAGFGHTCALMDGGTVRCWGDNSRGQLGTGDTTFRSFAVAVTGASNSRVNAIAAGHSHTCALRTRGELLCWGNNDSGQLGNATNFQRTAPTPVVGVNSDVVGLSAGLLHTCAVISNGRIRCWGENGSRQLGDTTTQNRTSPTDVTLDPFQRHFTGVAAGELHTCGLTVFHTIVCWGDNSVGQLGQGNVTGPSNPVTVTLGSAIGAVAVEAGDNHSCALRATGRVSCWGANLDGQLGLGTVTNTSEPAPLLIPPAGIPQALDLSVGSFHTCAVLIPGRVRCWGRNTEGQIGDGTTSPNRPSPVEVPNLTNIVSVEAGQLQTCALTADGRVFCWGLESRLGNGPAPAGNISPIPVQVQGILDAIQINMQTESTCVLLSDGTAHCWGRFIGNGEISVTHSTPTLMFNQVIAVAAGNIHRCGLLSDGTLVCRGFNGTGALGDGATFNSRTDAIAVVGIATGTLVSAGQLHTCALRTSGRANCWGDDGEGRLGDGPPTPTIQPGVVTPREVLRDNGTIPFPPLTLTLGISTGPFHTCVLQSTGAPFCWGRNTTRQLGVGSNDAFEDAAAEVPSFRFNIVPTGSLSQEGKRATLLVLANCQDKAQAHIELRLQQNTIVAEGHATVQCTDGLEAYPVDVRVEDKTLLSPGATFAEAVIEVRARGEIVEVLRWSRTVELSPE